MSLIISGATLLDGVKDYPLEEQSIWIERGRIKAIARKHELGASPDIAVFDARGKYAIPGLMNANVHLFAALNMEGIVRHMDCYEALIAEAAQIALRNGLTTIFDTWGPRRHLMAVRDRIHHAEIPGSRVFCAGNIVGFDGPFSADFLPKAAEVASPITVNRINAIWAENVGRHLMWLPPEKVAQEVGAYIAKGIDFVKYGSNDHYPASFLTFSPRVQRAIVEEAHRVGVTAQAHTTSVEGLHIAVAAGCDLIQHANVTGTFPIPHETLQLMAERECGATVFPWTEAGMDWIMHNVAGAERAWWQTSDINVRNLIQSGVPLLLANDGMVRTAEMVSDPAWIKGSLGAPDDLCLYTLDRGHFVWFKAMEEKGCHPMQMLKAATSNIAVAYGKDKDLGTLEPGKVADMLILDKNPLESAENYRSIHAIFKDGKLVNRDALPLTPVLTKVAVPPAEEELSYIPFINSGKFPLCPACAHRGHIS